MRRGGTVTLSAGEYFAARSAREPLAWRAISFPSPWAIPVRACHLTSSLRCSTPSLPRKARAKAPAWACRRCTVLSTNPAASVDITANWRGDAGHHLPAARDGEPMRRNAEAIEDIDIAGRKILLVEDNPDVAEATKALLADLSCDARVAADARQALDMLGEERFDLVLSDIVMAGPMNGLELARRIRTEYPDLPVVLATGYSQPATLAVGEFRSCANPMMFPTSIGRSPGCLPDPTSSHRMFWISEGQTADLPRRAAIVRSPDLEALAAPALSGVGYLELRRHWFAGRTP